jgi:hypothetical protein
VDEIIHEEQVLAFVILPLVNVRGCTITLYSRLFLAPLALFHW